MTQDKEFPIYRRKSIMSEDNRHAGLILFYLDDYLRIQNSKAELKAEVRRTTKK